MFKRIHRKSSLHRAIKPVTESLERRVLLSGSVVINEIHFDPDVKSEEVEFVELTNPGDAAVDLSGASFTAGITYTFPSGTSLAAGGYLVVAANPASVQTKFGIAGVLGPWTGKLSNDGEKITLTSSTGTTLDEVDYKQGYPWPTVGDSPGRSIELINPTFDNSLGGNWRSGVTQVDTTLINAYSAWRYRKGTSEASSPTSAWRNLSFTEDSTWATGTAAIGYDPSLAMGTTLSDMNGNYTCVFMRKTFNVGNPSSYQGLRLEAKYDDGFNVWVNGQIAATVGTSAAELAYTATASISREDGNFQTIALNPSLLASGTNIIAVQFFNISKSGSSDAFFDGRLIASTGGGGPTPGKKNFVYAANAAPQTRQLTQSVQQPAAGQDVTIGIKSTDPDGVASMTLDYQLVDPGNYIRKTDAAYSTSWTTVTMHDDGLNGDAVAGDSIYSVTLPGSIQTNRRLVRYRINATDTLGASVRVPYADDSQSNFAYFVYNGVPSWTGADNPGTTSTQTFGTDITNGGMAVYHLIANATDVANSQYVSSYENVDFIGTMVYDGVVYDHVQYSVRGQYSTYVSGKNKWAIHFNTGHDFAARDNYGHLYAEKWGKLVLNANASPWMPVNRGMAGLDEAVSQRLFQLAGVLAPNTNYVQWRVIDDAQEAPSSNQYGGDLWGLYLAIENPGGHFTDQHGIDDGNIYQIEAGNGDLKNQGAGQPSDGSDWNTFKASASTTTASQAWWQANLNLEDFYSFTAINRVTSNVDLRDGDNYYMYHSPDGLWQPIPWDLDMMYAPETHQSGKTYLSNSLVYSAMQLGLKNRAREILDLLFADKSRTGGQVAQLVDEYARMVDRSNGAGGYQTGMAELDQYMWNHNPRTSSDHAGAFYRNPANDTRWGGTWTRTLSSADFKGMVQYVIDFMTDTDPNSWSIGDGDQRGYGFNYLEYEATDTGIPNTPTVSYTGGANFPVNQIKFNTSAFSDSDGGSFAGMEWRVGEISNPTTAGFDPSNAWKYEIQSVWESGQLSTYNPTISIPASVFQAGHTYRVRVRMLDNAGKWSHWSDVTVGATQFAPTAATSTLGQSLRVTELNYNPTALAGSSYDKEEFEFIELKNFGDQRISLKDAEFTAGITYTFGDVSLEPGQVGVLVKNLTAFQTRYGTSIKILGSYESGGKFDNAGERVTLVDSEGLVVKDFTYDDDPNTGWYASTDGGGNTLVVVNPSANLDLNTPTNWRPSRALAGSPGFDETVPHVTKISVSGSSWGQRLPELSQHVRPRRRRVRHRRRCLADRVGPVDRRRSDQDHVRPGRQRAEDEPLAARVQPRHDRDAGLRV